MQTPLGPSQCVQNIVKSVFWRLPIVFPVDVATSILHAIAHFVALAT